VCVRRGHFYIPIASAAQTYAVRVLSPHHTAAEDVREFAVVQRALADSFSYGTNFRDAINVFFDDKENFFKNPRTKSIN